jgi:hypothetical protein
METSQTIEARGGYVPTRLDSDSTRVTLLASPLKGILYLWCGVFWIWMLVACLSDQYPVFRTFLETHFSSTSVT